MYTLLRYVAGVVVEGVVFPRGKNRIRAVVAGFPDTIELRRSGLQWFTATGEEVEFDFLMSNTCQGESVAAPEPARVAWTGMPVAIEA
jgi:hypothetical protein